MDRLATVMFWGGIAMLAAALFVGRTAFDDYGSQLEQRRCKQERRIASSNGRYTVSDRCNELSRGSALGGVLAIGGIASLIAARALKRKKGK